MAGNQRPPAGVQAVMLPAPPPRKTRSPKGGAPKARHTGMLVAALLLTVGLSACAANPGNGSQAAPSSAASWAAAPSKAAAGAPTGHGSASAATAAGPAAGTAHTVGVTVSAAQPQVVRSATIGLSVAQANLQAAVSRADAVAVGQGGYVQDSSTSARPGTRASERLVLRVPASRFAATITGIERLGAVTGSSISGTDVTGQLVDLKAQVANLGAEEVALRQLASHAASVKDLLQVQGQLFNVRGELQQLTAQRAQLANQAAFATIKVNLVAAAPAARPSPGLGSAFATAAGLAARNTAQVLRFVVLAAGWLFPGLVLAGAGLAAYAMSRRYRRRRHGRSVPPAPATEA
ncbi:MAG: DUF4349 domain-containing protein [Acidimicrobiales bacterium]